MSDAGMKRLSELRKEGRTDVLLCSADDIRAISEEHSALLEEKALQIASGLRSAVVNLISVGQALSDVQDLIDPEQFAEFAKLTTSNKSASWIRKAMEAYQFSLKHPEIDLTALAVGSIFELTAPSTPPKVIEQVAQRVAQADPPSEAEIQEMKSDAAQRVAPVDHDIDRTSQAPQIETSDLTPKQGVKLLKGVRNATQCCIKDKVPPQIVRDMLNGLSDEVLAGGELVGLDDQTMFDTLKGTK